MMMSELVVTLTLGFKRYIHKVVYFSLFCPKRSQPTSKCPININVFVSSK